jgi:Zn-finger nucleic acid-binding protein
MTYRQGPPLPCPHCGVQLAAFEEARPKWRCRSCGGTLVGGEELQFEVASATPVELAPRMPIRPPLACPICGDPMIACAIHDVPAERCERDRCVWFERGDLGRARRGLVQPIRT